MPTDRDAARDCGGDPTQKLAEGEQAARGAAEPTRENLARVHVGSSPDAGSAAPGFGSTVAALFVEKDGAYFGLPGVDPWDEARDARLYDGPWPVVAHPPCNKWSPLAYINQRRIPGYVMGDDGGCFESAMNAVETFGGVLEHPANSLAWRTFGLPKPARPGWNVSMHGHPGWATEVDQGAYGHRARKRTWLYFVGCPSPGHPFPLDWTESESDAIVSGFTHQPKGEHVACEHRRVRPKEASRTPAAFRDVLLELARASRMAVAA